MDIDLSYRDNLTPGEKTELRFYVQCAAMAEIAAAFPGGDAVLHGGSSLRVGMGSPRHSEDLDFYLKDDSWRHRLEDMIEGMTDRISQRVCEDLPGSSVDFKKQKDRTGEDGIQRTSGWLLKWSHPNRTGSVKVKLEFCRISPKLLGDYPLTSAEALGQRLSIPTTLAAWGDKVVASGMRSYRKVRDFYDLHFLGQLIDPAEAPSEDRRRCLETIAQIYGYDLKDLVAGIEAASECPEIRDTQAFSDEMSAWFDDEDHAAIDWIAVLSDAKAELDTAFEVLHPSVGMRP